MDQGKADLNVEYETEMTKCFRLQKLTNERWPMEKHGVIYELLDQCDRLKERPKILLQVLKPKNFNSYTKQCKIVFSLLKSRRFFACGLPQLAEMG